MATSNYRRGAVVRLEGEPIFEPNVLANDVGVSGDLLWLQPCDQQTTLDAAVYLGVDSIILSTPSTIDVGICEVYTAINVACDFPFEVEAEIYAGNLLSVYGELSFEAEADVTSGSLVSVQADLDFLLNARVAVEIPMWISADLQFSVSASVFGGSGMVIAGDLEFEIDSVIISGTELYIASDLTFEASVFFWPTLLGTQSEGLAFNTMTGSVAPMSPFKFDSVEAHNGMILVTDGLALYSLTGTIVDEVVNASDTTIDAELALPTMDLYTGGGKIATDCVVACRSLGAVKIDSVYDEVEEQITASVPYYGRNLGERKADLPRGERPRFLQLHIRNSAGAVIDIKEVIVLGSPRRRFNR